MKIVTAICTYEQAQILLRYDHHRVQVQQAAGVLLTYHWMEQELTAVAAPFTVKVAMQYGPLHPPAPPAAQQVIDQLHFVE